jgi:hypothetical protein
MTVELHLDRGESHFSKMPLHLSTSRVAAPSGPGPGGMHSIRTGLCEFGDWRLK